MRLAHRARSASPEAFLAVCLVAVAVAFLLAPGTAEAQGPSVHNIHRTPGDNTQIRIIFNRVMSSGAFSKDAFTVTVGGLPQTINRVQQFANGNVLNVFLDSPLIPYGAIVVTYDASVNPVPVIASDSTTFGSFTVSVPFSVTTDDIYNALKAYFSGDAGLSPVESFLRTHAQKTYHAALLEDVAAGRLHQRFEKNERTQWGKPGTEDWVQMGSPSFPGPRPWLICGGEPRPVLTGADSGQFFWACTGDNRWVPVKLPQPGVDYSREDDLIRPGQPGYDERCRYRDADGNPTPLFKTHYHPQDHADPELRGKPVYVNGQIQGTVIHGNNWDPLAGRCRGRAD